MKLNRVLAILTLGCLLFNMQCDEDDVNSDSVFCDGDEVVIDNSEYQDPSSNDFSVESLDLNSNCLNVNVTASGCSGETWELVLIDSGDIMESFPPQRNLRFKFTNIEACLAVFTKPYVFDISSLQVEGVNEVLLNFDGVADSILYSY